MKCGAKRFLAEIEINEKRKHKTVIARTPAAARRIIRNEYGAETKIISVIEDSRASV